MVCEIYPDETSEFWRAPGITADEQKKINTTVYRLPGAGFAEKDGSFTNSARWLQWKNAALPPPGQARLDQDILATIFLKVRELYQKEGGKFPDPDSECDVRLYDSVRSLVDRSRERDQRQGAGRHHRSEDERHDQGRAAASGLCLAQGRRHDFVAETGFIADRWTEAGALTQRRGTEDPSGLGVYPNWAWSWPMNRRVLYNRASCDIDGQAVGCHASSGLVG